MPGSTVAPCRIVIVGAGHAGGACALALREFGFDGTVILLGEERHRPYERPALSKAMLTIDGAVPTALAEEARWTEGFDLRLGVPVAAINRERRLVCLADGTELLYDALVLATGGSARRLEVPGGDLAHTLRTSDDAAALRARIRSARSAVVIGGGVIGLEVAASFRSSGLSVHVIEAAPRILGRNVPAEAAAWIAELHEREGVEMRLGTTIRSIAAADGGAAVTLGDGTVLESDLVVQGIGIRPRTELAEAAGLPCRDGLLVGPTYASTTDPSVWGIGDLAFREGAIGGARQESWAHAQGSARAVARAILGLSSEPNEAPWFWSDQYGHRLRVVGAPAEADESITRGPRFRLYLRAGRVVGAACLDAARDFAIARRLVAARARLDRAKAAQTGGDLRKAVAA
ncbi:NAD(P)/FAD-dependent oxidoreductase [Roseomonas sp. WA12]